MSEEKLWYSKKNAANCSQCLAPDSIEIYYYQPTRQPVITGDEFVITYQVIQKTKKVCVNCNFTEEFFEEWKEYKYPKKEDIDFLKRRAIYFQTNFKYKAEEAFADYLERNPSDFEMLFEFGRYLLANREIIKAYSNFKKSIEKNPNFLPAMEAITDLLFQLLNAQNDYWFECLPYYGFYSHIHLTYQNFLNELNKYLRLLIEHHKNNLQLLPAYYLKTAPLLEEKFLFPLALEYYEYVMSQSPFKVEQADASLRAGLLYAQLQDYPKAISLLDNSNLLLPNLMIHYHKAKVYRKTEDSMKSNAEVSIFLKSLDSLILKNENDPRLYYFKGLGLELIQDSKELIEYYQSVIEKGKFDIPIRTIFQRKINNLLDPPRREIISSQNFNCPVCKSNEFIFYTYRDQVVGSIKPKESLNTVYYYLQVLRKICNHCQFEFKEYKSWEDIDFDTQI